MASRNDPCSCGSGKRHKHCHGASAPVDESDDGVTDQALIAALKRADDECVRLGEGPPTRSIQNISRALREFGYHSFVLMGRRAPAIVKRAHIFKDMLFVPKDLQSGANHSGAFLFRDMFCKLYAPIIFGVCQIDCSQMIDLSDLQKQWLAEDPDHLARFVDQASDVLDFGFGWQEFGYSREIDPRGRDLIWRAHEQLEAAAATAISSGDSQGTIQSALLGTELALKAGLAALGVTNAELKNGKKIGHNLVAATTRLGDLCPAFDADRVSRVVASFPNFVASRYDLPVPSRTEIGHILMGAQYVASEVTRQFSDRNGRRDNPDSPARQYPA